MYRVLYAASPGRIPCYNSFSIYFQDLTDLLQGLKAFNYVSNEVPVVRLESSRFPVLRSSVLA